MEIWKDIQGYEGLYQVSNEGRVKSLRKNKILKTWKQNKYYQVVSLGANCKRLVHILVAKVFIPNPQNKPQVDHIIPLSEGGTDDASNLRWVTPHENNMNERTRKNMSDSKKGSISPMKGKLNREDISKQVAQINPTTGEILHIWKSTMDVKRNLGYDNGNISRCCNGKIKTYKGYIWIYI